MAQQITAIIEQLNLPITIYNGQLVVVMSEACKTLGYELRDFAKNYCWTGLASDLPGTYKLLRGTQLASFKSLLP